MESIRITKFLNYLVYGLAIVGFVWSLFQVEILPANPDLSSQMNLQSELNSKFTFWLSLITLLACFQWLKLTLKAHKLPEQISPVFGLTPLIICSSFTASLLNIDSLLATLFLLFAVSQLLDVYQQKTIYRQAFLSGLWLSFSLLFDSSFILFLILPFISFLFFRPFSLKENLTVVVGLVLPWVYLLSGRYFFGWSQTEFSVPLNFPWSGELDLSWTSIVGFIILLTLLLAAFFFTFQAQAKLVVRKRNQLNVLFLFAFVSLISCLTVWSPGTATILFALSAACFLPWMFLSISKPWIVILILAISLGFIQWHSILNF